jgi:hypothetical protein
MWISRLCYRVERSQPRLFPLKLNSAFAEL